MRWVITGIGVLLFLVGIVWFFQGIGVLPGSVMTGQSFWAVIGVLFVVVGVAVGFFGHRRKPASQ
jgi:hypothetical protein